jgi:DNA-binding MarR family transcriptional regulator
MRTTSQPASATGRPADTVRALIDEIGRSFRELRCVGSQRLVKLGVSMTHLHILTMLQHHGALPMSKLADLLDVSLSNTTGLIDRLEDRGYVERVRVPDDRRVVLVQLTPAADQVLREAEVLRADLVAGLLARLDDAELARVESGFAAFLSGLREELASDPVRYAHRHDVPVSPDRSAAPARLTTT